MGEGLKKKNWLVELVRYPWILIVVAGLLIISVSVISSITLGKDSKVVSLRPDVDVRLIGVGVLVVVLGVLFERLKVRPHVYPDLSGRWQYNVHKVDGSFSHQGDCDISQEGRRLRFVGTRRLMCLERDGQVFGKKVNIPWESDWSAICHDSKVRFDYNICISETTRLKATCRLGLVGGQNGEMAGEYFLLPPFDSKLLNAQYGRICFKRISPNTPLDVPSGIDAIDLDGMDDDDND